MTYLHEGHDTYRHEGYDTHLHEGHDTHLHEGHDTYLHEDHDTYLHDGHVGHHTHLHEEHEGHDTYLHEGLHELREGHVQDDHIEGPISIVGGHFVRRRPRVFQGQPPFSPPLACFDEIGVTLCNTRGYKFSL